ncbi:MAG: exodeoxyribonuclease VII large subunit [Paludibacteraceae bacterium]|nr:exodeoxyribonuclease VII large subunit [Paludibacteraceae bacterium]
MASLTLTELCTLIGEALDDSLAPSYWVRAEISSLSVKGGHMYLDLVDGKTAKMRATCWAGTREMLSAYFEAETGQPLQAGMSVLVETEIQWHPVYGLSLSIVNIDPSYTLGEVARLRQQTIAALQADGLLEAQQLLTLPTLIRRLAVVSSPSAAGYEDFKHQLVRSGYAFETTLFGATMQGPSAPASVIAALEEIVNLKSQISIRLQPIVRGLAEIRNLKSFDAVIIIRGGGAVSDLSCFDDYTLCAYCAQYELPILSGIGHTRDVSILDMVAHEALKTPTAVAEWLIHRMDTQKERLETLRTRLQRTAERQILIRQHRVEMLEQRLAACNPERIYRMGYSLLTKDGRPVRSVTALRPGDIVTTHLADGAVQSSIIHHPS